MVFQVKKAVHPTLDHLVFIDVETSGLKAGVDRVIEVGMVRVRNNRIVEEYSQLINAGVIVSDRITQINGINNVMLEGKPIPEKIIPEVKQWAGDAIMFAHNAPFDKRFMLSEFGRYGQTFDNIWVCTLALAKRLLKLENHKILTISRYLEIPMEDIHRATDDAKATAIIWFHLYDLITQLYNKEGNTGLPDLAYVLTLPKKLKCIKKD